VKLLRGILLTLLITTAIPAYAVVVEGSFSTMYEHSKYKGDSSEGTWENTLILDNVKLINPYLGFNFHGSYSIEDGENYTDIYSAYLHFKNFEDALEIKLGRFSFLGNRFLTLDGIEATLRTINLVYQYLQVHQNFMTVTTEQSNKHSEMLVTDCTVAAYS
jgi:hypothetical protein